MNEKQFETILAALADKIKEQETTIDVQRWQIEKLEAIIAAAEEEGKAPTKLEIR